MNHRVYPVPYFQVRNGAQRLSASTNESHWEGRVVFFLFLVLNAFRHQRMNHHRQIQNLTLSLRVLNAFRHQRMNHGGRFNAFGRDVECSTPFGINE